MIAVKISLKKNDISSLTGLISIWFICFTDILSLTGQTPLGTKYR